MSNNANPLKEAQTDVDKAANAVFGLLNPKEEEEIGKSEPPKEEIKQDSPEPKNEESESDQPQEQEITEETESEQEEVSEEDVSQDEEQSDVQEKPDSTEDQLHKVKVAGQEFDVTLDELKSGYSRDSDYRRKTEELSFEKKNFLSETEKQRQDYSKKLNEVSQLAIEAKKQIDADLTSADLEQLYEDDPTEAARVEHKLRRKQEKLAVNLSKLKEEQTKQWNDVLRGEQRKLINKLPEFADATKATSLKQNMRSYLNGYGFNDSEVGQIYDHRIVMLVNDAMKYRNRQNSKPNLAKKISKPGKVFSSGAKKENSDYALKSRKEKFSRLKKSGNINDAASIFLDMINK